MPRILPNDGSRALAASSPQTAPGMPHSLDHTARLARDLAALGRADHQPMRGVALHGRRTDGFIATCHCALQPLASGRLSAPR